MNYNDISILVVDDAKFTLEMLRRGLQSNGYKDVRASNSATEALAMMRDRPANVLLADWMMPEMDGLALTDQVRQLDEENQHYTYIILLTAKDGVQSLTEAFKHGVDDFINKSPDNKELLARIHAAGRISTLQNTLLETTQRLTELNHKLEKQSAFDLLTGLGNEHYYGKRLHEFFRYTTSRGGGTCIGLVNINEYEDFAARYKQDVMDEIIIGVASRLTQAVRPLDVVTRIEKGLFAVIMHQNDMEHWHASSFKRVFQNINLRAFKTQAGFVSLSAAVTITGIDGKTEKPDPAKILTFLRSTLGIAKDSQRIHVAKWGGA